MNYVIAETLTKLQINQIIEFVSKIECGSLYQMPLWQEIDKSAGIRYIYTLQFEDEKLIGVSAIRLKKLPIINRSIGMCIRGPVCSNENSYRAMLLELDKVCIRHKIVSLIIHPYKENIEADVWENICQQVGYRNIQKKGDLHCASLTINLEQNIEDIFKTFRQTTKYEIKKADKFNIKCTIAENEAELKEFYNIYNSTSDRKSFSAMSYEILLRIWKKFTIQRKLGVLFLTRYENKIISGALILVHGERAVYTIGGSAGAITKGIPQNHITQWSAINWAKENGCKKYDFGGIEPDTDNIGMKNINIFKGGFSKNEVKIFNRHEKVFSPLLHQVISLYLRIKEK